MNSRQQRFAEEYTVDHIGAASAIRAGYKASRAKQTAHRLLARTDVAAHVEGLDKQKREELGVDARQLMDWVLELRERALRGSPRTYRDEVVRDEHGDVIYDPNLNAAVKALELVARHLGLLSDRSTVEHVGNVVYTLHLDRNLEQEDAA